MGFIPFSFVDFIDIVLVATILFFLYRATRGTSAPYIMAGIVMIYLVWVVVKAFNMELLATILGQVISVGMIAIIILFQPEIRRFLRLLGNRQKELTFLSRFFSSGRKDSQTVTSPIVSACKEMSQSRTGALIVFRKKDDLQAIEESGIAIDALITTSLVKNIFFKNAPLHDGAVVVEGDRIVAAKCILPVTQSIVPKSYGTRHRAAIGLSEVTDAVVLVVSEETGAISIAFRGELKSNIDMQSLAQELRDFLAIA